MGLKTGAIYQPGEILKYFNWRTGKGDWGQEGVNSACLLVLFEICVCRFHWTMYLLSKNFVQFRRCLILRIWFWTFLSSHLTPVCLQLRATFLGSLLLEISPPRASWKPLCLPGSTPSRHHPVFTSPLPPRPQSWGLVLFRYLSWTSSLSTYQTSVPLLLVEASLCFILWPEKKPFFSYVHTNFVYVEPVSWGFTYASALLVMVIILVVVTHITLIGLCLHPPVQWTPLPPSLPHFWEAWWYLQGAPSLLLLLTDFKLLMGVPCREATRGHCFISATVPAIVSQRCLVLMPKDGERSPFFSPLPQVFLPGPKAACLVARVSWSPSPSICRHQDYGA